VDQNRKNATRHFGTIQKAIDDENECILIKINLKGNFARTFLRLHRTLLFFVQFLQTLNIVRLILDLSISIMICNET
jgi:hypothetical protein